MIEIDNCLVCIHGLYETDREIFCHNPGDCDNFELITDEELEFLFDEWLNDDNDVRLLKNCQTEIDKFQDTFHHVLLDKLSK